MAGFKYFQILSLILIIGVVAFFVTPKYTYHHPSGEDFIIRSNIFTGKMEKVYFNDPWPQKLPKDAILLK